MERPVRKLGKAWYQSVEIELREEVVHEPEGHEDKEDGHERGHARIEAWVVSIQHWDAEHLPGNGQKAERPAA